MDLEETIREDLRYSEGDTSTADDSVKGYESRYPGNPYVAAARKRITDFVDFEPDEGTSDDRDYEEDPPTPTRVRVRSIFDDVVDRPWQGS